MSGCLLELISDEVGHLLGVCAAGRQFVCRHTGACPNISFAEAGGE